MTHVFARFSTGKHVLASTRVLATAAALCFAASTVQAQDPKPIYPISQIPVTLDGALIAPGRGLTAAFEIQFMEGNIDHHFAALRMTELAAGTAPQRNGALAPGDGVAGTPGYKATPAKSTLDDLKSLARQANRTQREEILTLVTYLRDWYGINYQPLASRISPQNAQRIQILENTAAGTEFNKAFYETFSRHHYILLDPLNQCITSADLAHPDLAGICNQQWHSQSAQITTMRRDLARHYAIVDYQPLVDPSGQYTDPGK